jgi:pyruvate dehydrogenase E1 component alpha subunit
MLLLRIAERDLAKYFIDKKVFSMVHFYVGEEAIAVGVSENLNSEDKVLGNHRSHGHYLARGGNLQKMIDEIFGKNTGCCKGKGGSMHMIDKSVNFIGSTPILGSVTGIASGVAFAQKYRKEKGITVCYFGDGASEEGVVYESMNFSSLFRLPLLMVIENNRYSTSSRLEFRRGQKYDSSLIAKGLDINYFRANGNDFFSVFYQARASIEAIKTTNKPSVLECNVYRHMAHSSPLYDDLNSKSWYREEDDNPDTRTKEDSVLKLKNFLIKNGKYEVELQNLEKSIEEQVRQAIEKSQIAPYPQHKDLYTHVYG